MNKKVFRQILNARFAMCPDCLSSCVPRFSETKAHHIMSSPSALCVTLKDVSTVRTSVEPWHAVSTSSTPFTYAGRSNSPSRRRVSRSLVVIMPQRRQGSSRGVCWWLGMICSGSVVRGCRAECANRAWGVLKTQSRPRIKSRLGDLEGCVESARLCKLEFTWCIMARRACL